MCVWGGGVQGEMVQQRSRNANLVQVFGNRLWELLCKSGSYTSYVPSPYKSHCPALRFSTSAWTQLWTACPHFRCEEEWGL